MEIILLQKINKLGNIGDAVKVKPGYGRNFLIPTGKALRATKENKDFFESTKAKLLKENKEAVAKAEKIRTEVENLKLVIVRSASDTGVLFGSVTTRDISKLIIENGITLSRKQIALDKPIKELGIFDVSVILHPEVESKIKLKVVRSLEDSKTASEDAKGTDTNSDEFNQELNESFLEDGVALKAEESDPEEIQIENDADNNSAEQS